MATLKRREAPKRRGTPPGGGSPELHEAQRRTFGDTRCVVQRTEGPRPKPRSAGVRRRSRINRGLYGGPSKGADRIGNMTIKSAVPRSHAKPPQRSIAIHDQRMIKLTHSSIIWKAFGRAM